jgi:GNAT superfamily N-acetyltransferase
LLVQPSLNGRIVDARVMADAAQEIRRGRDEDCDAIIELIEALRREDGGAPSDRDAAAAAVRSCLTAPGSGVYVAARGGAVDGFIVVHWIPFPMLAGTEAYISDLIVERMQRGRGTGRRLVAVVESEARRRGCVRLMLNNRVAAESFKRAFYSKLGFRARDDFANLVRPL